MEKITTVSVNYENEAILKLKSAYLTLVECFSLLCGLQADLWPILLFLWNRFALSIYPLPLSLGKDVSI